MTPTDKFAATDCSGRIFNCHPSEPADISPTSQFAGTSFPAAIDLREGWWTVGDQGDTGACVGWATADSVLRWHFVKAGKLPKSEELSPRFTWMAAKERDKLIARPTTFIETSGTQLLAALQVSNEFGAVKRSFWPGVGELYKGEEDAFFKEAEDLKIKKFKSIPTSTTRWREWLGNDGGPILTRLVVDRTWINATATGGRLEEYDGLSDKCGGHAVAFVGYTPDGFIVRNSWGTVWGDQGFAYASDAYAIAAFTESWGVSV